MKKSTEKNIVRVIFVLSILGIVISLYLLENHYASTSSFCDIGEVASCSLVNASIYSELFNVPVALLGALWFIILALMAWKAFRKKEALLLLAEWNVVGLLSVIYLVIAEFLLRAICLLCTAVHVIILITLTLSIMLYRSQKRKFSFKSAFKAARPWIIGIIILNLVPLIYFNLLQGEKENHDALAQCLTEKGVHMYGSFRCAVCAKTRAMFGDSFQYVQEIECHPQGKNSQWQLCQDKAITGTPTWILEPNGQEVKRHTGFLSIEELKEFSGCS